MSMPWITEELRAGRNYSRWIEVEDSNGYRVRCNCGFSSDWDKSVSTLRQQADQIHRAH